ncbi:H-2 class I histocompatibility antigen, alpha chain-like [Colossoma macropomum]|uniref:H-2 class I histocompatibility antigen, alpha chain-like n=1 Tax=Colossoma macropomum TaxID=42526 RepID=UPI001864908A|nr:H-2 class I histocompatibility antigen, alpha chain-like [Colossoma macropomum]
MMGVHTTLCVVLLSGLFASVFGDKHSLRYLCFIQSKSSSDRVSEFSAVTLLDDRQIDSYSSTDGVRTPKQDWMKEITSSEWKAGTDELKHDGEELNVVLNNLTQYFRHNRSDGHIVQWRFGCEGEKHSDGSVPISNCINEYAYDGESVRYYNWFLKEWSFSVNDISEMEDWNSENAEWICKQCALWLRLYLHYNITETKQTPPDVHMFVKKCATDSTKLTLTCMATGFYPKDVEIKLRKFRTSLPEHLLTSSGVRPNDDETYQMRKSVDIQEDDTAEYDCYVTHSSLREPVIKKWERPHSQVSLGLAIGVPVAVLIVAVLVFILKWKAGRGISGSNRSNTEKGSRSCGSQQGRVENADETTPILQRQFSDPNRQTVQCQRNGRNC